MNKHAKILFVGAGNMGGALILGLIKDGYPSEHLMACDQQHQHLVRLAEQFGIQTATVASDLASAADVVVFAVKPQQMQSAAIELKDIIVQRSPLVMSVAAGIRTQQLSQWLGNDCAIVRAMPNTPALVGSGATACYANGRTSAEQHALAESIMRAVSLTLWVDHENLLDTVTAISGSGPAYFFLVMEALQQAGEANGLSAETAKLLTIQTALGAARMALESNEDIAELRRHVTSQGGTTERAIEVLEESGLKKIFQRAVTAAKERSEELAKLFG